MRSKTADNYIAVMAAQKTPYTVTVSDIELQINQGVFATGEIGELFYEAIATGPVHLKSSKVLDYGTGSGFLAIVAAKYGAEVVAIDKSLASIECAKFNAKQNQVDNLIDFRWSDNLSAIDENEQFDYILAGLPWEEAIPLSSLEMAFYDEQFSMRRALAHRSKNLLRKNGLILMSYSERVQKSNPMENFFKGFDVSILLEKQINDEPHYILAIGN